MTSPFRSSSFFIAALIVAFGARSALAQGGEGAAPAPPDPDPVGVAVLVVDLGDPEWSVRERAHERLRAMGIAVRPFIEKAIEGTTDGEVLGRLEKLLDEVCYVSWRGQVDAAARDARASGKPLLIVAPGGRDEAALLEILADPRVGERLERRFVCAWAPVLLDAYWHGVVKSVVLLCGPRGGVAAELTGEWTVDRLLAVTDAFLAAIDAGALAESPARVEAALPKGSSEQDAPLLSVPSGPFRPALEPFGVRLLRIADEREPYGADAFI